jgi:hypothetical protein
MTDTLIVHEIGDWRIAVHQQFHTSLPWRATATSWSEVEHADGFDAESALANLADLIGYDRREVLTEFGLTG